MLKKHHQLMLAMLRVGDLLACWLAFTLAWVLAHWVHPKGEFSESVKMMTMLVAVVMTLPVFSRLGLYTPKRTQAYFWEFTLLVRGVTVVWCLSYVVVSLLIPDRPSRVLMGLLLPSWMVVGGIVRLIGRTILRQMRRRGWNLRHAVIIGTGRLGQTLYHTLKRNKWMGIEPSYFIHAGNAEGKLLGKPVVGPYAKLEDILQSRPIDVVFIALPAREHEELEALVEELSQGHSHLDVRVVPDMISYNLLRHEMEQIENLPVVNLMGTPLEGWNALIKRWMDIVVSAIALVIISPLLAVVALAVKFTSQGPIFYRQTRASLGGMPFEIIKFRTMSTDAEANCGPVWSSGKSDQRVTPIGHFLRRWNLDELPQFWNVLVGHMSLVGPRPERPELVERFGRKIPRYMLRQRVKSGITGWAQVNGLRGRTSLRKRVQYDLFYLMNWTVGFDVKILMMTLNPFASKKVHRGPEFHDEAWALEAVTFIQPSRPSSANSADSHTPSPSSFPAGLAR